MKYYPILLLTTVLSAGCFQDSKDRHAVYIDEIPKDAPNHYRWQIDYTKDLISYDVPPSEPNILKHTREGEVVFLSRIIEAPIWFEHNAFNYKLPYPQYREAHEARVSLAVRYSNDGDHWTDWLVKAPAVGEGRGSPELWLRRYPGPILFNHELFKYLQFKIISNPENQGKVIMEDLYISVIRAPILKKSPKNGNLAP